MDPWMWIHLFFFMVQVSVALIIYIIFKRNFWNKEEKDCAEFSPQGVQFGPREIVQLLRNYVFAGINAKTIANVENDVISNGLYTVPKSYFTLNEAENSQENFSDIKMDGEKKEDVSTYIKWFIKKSLLKSPSRAECHQVDWKMTGKKRSCEEHSSKDAIQINNLPLNITKDALLNGFEICGCIKNIIIDVDNRTAVIYFKNFKSALLAIIVCRKGLEVCGTHLEIKPYCEQNSEIQSIISKVLGPKCNQFSESLTSIKTSSEFFKVVNIRGIIQDLQDALKDYKSFQAVKTSWRMEDLNFQDFFPEIEKEARKERKKRKEWNKKMQEKAEVTKAEKSVPTKGFLEVLLEKNPVQKS